MSKIKQRTIAKEISASGIGLHSGDVINITLKPAEADSGIVFVRKDLGGKELKVSPDAVASTTLCTQIKKGDIEVSTVEHLMASLCVCGIDNIIVELDSAEVPVFDGSSMPFIYLFESAGVKKLNQTKKFVKVMREVKIEKDSREVTLKPDDNFSIDLEIDFNHPVIPRQEVKIDINFESFRTELARARTFCFQKDVEAMQSAGLALGGGLDNAVVVSDYSIINKEGLRYKDEFIRHKILDCVGDLYMYGLPILGAFKGSQTGHGLNNLLLKELFSDDLNWRTVELPEEMEFIFLN